MLKRGRKKLDRYAIKNDIYDFFFIARGFDSIQSMMVLSLLVDKPKAEHQEKILFSEAEYKKLFDY